MAATGSSPFLTTLLAERPPAGSELEWLSRLRSQALERANALSVPSTRDEEWRFTDLSALTRLSFQPVRSAGALDAADLRARFIPEACARLVFVDGVFVPQLSELPAVGGVLVSELRAAIHSSRAAELEAHLGKLARIDANLFAALNTAFLDHGAVIVLDADAALSAPVQILHVATRRERAHAIYPRTLLMAGARSRCTLIEDFVATEDAGYFAAPVTEIVAAREASIEHVRLQRQASGAFDLGTCAVAQAAGSRYQAANVVLGARLSRLDWHVAHEGPGCETVLDGLTLIGARQLADTHSMVDHAHPQGRLRQLHKAVASGGAHAVFNGKILVRQGAQRTDAAQSCRGLLLSAHAHIDAKPQLEIFADDVKCAHGAAIGQLDPEEAFYLQCRGLSAQKARNLLTYGFAAEVIERIPVASVVRELERALVERTVEGTA
ncbi:MAG: Fe-S cluster assembly protein SufD [Burkholderiales bacterium]